MDNNVTNKTAESSNSSTQYSVEEKTNGDWSPEELQSSSAHTARSVQADRNIEIQANGQYLTTVHEEAATNGATLIDFEYAGYNYRAWDIANHFNEFAGFDFNIEKDFPIFDQRTEFLSHYVRGVCAHDLKSKSYLSGIVNNPDELKNFTEGLQVPLRFLVFIFFST